MSELSRAATEYGAKRSANDYGKWVIDFAADTNHICIKQGLVYLDRPNYSWALDLPVWVPNPEQPEQLYAGVQTQEVLTLKDVRKAREPLMEAFRSYLTRNCASMATHATKFQSQRVTDT